MSTELFIKNLFYIGRKLYLQPRSKKEVNFNVSAFANDLGQSAQTVTLWLNGNSIHKTTLSRISKRISELFNHNITPEILLNINIEELLSSKSTKNQDASKYGTSKKINEILDRYPELKKPILKILESYDKK